MARKESTPFAEALRRIRRAKGLTQTELAVLIGQHPTLISLYETGRRRPGLKDLNALADALGTTSDLLTGRRSSPGFAGPVAERLAAAFGSLNLRDQNAVVALAEYLAAAQTR